jgi:hypothetical protein
MLVDARGMGMGPGVGLLLRPHLVVPPAGTVWEVTQADEVLGYSAPGGGAAPSAGAGRPLPAMTLGSTVEVDAECGLWVRLKVGVPEGQDTWVELDAFLAG